MCVFRLCSPHHTWKVPNTTLELVELIQHYIRRQIKLSVKVHRRSLNLDRVWHNNCAKLVRWWVQIEHERAFTSYVNMMGKFDRIDSDVRGSALSMVDFVILRLRLTPINICAMNEMVSNSRCLVWHFWTFLWFRLNKQQQQIVADLNSLLIICEQVIRLQEKMKTNVWSFLLKLSSIYYFYIKRSYIRFWLFLRIIKSSYQ